MGAPEHEAIHAIRVAQGDLLSDHPAHGDAEDVCLRDAQGRHEADRVRGKHGDRVFLVRFVRQAGPPVVEQEELEVLLQLQGERLPPRQVAGEAHDEDQRRPLADHPMVHAQAVYVTEGHGDLRLG